MGGANHPARWHDKQLLL